MRSVNCKYIRDRFFRPVSVSRQGSDPCLGAAAAFIWATAFSRLKLRLPTAQRVIDTNPVTFRSIARTLWRGASDRHGTAAVEFGMIGVPAVLTLCAILEIGLNYFMVAALDHATLTAARAIATGAVSTSGLSASNFNSQVVCPALPSMFNCSNVFVNLTIVAQGQSPPSPYYSYVNSSKSGLIVPALNTTLDTFSPGTSCSYVVLQVLYPAPYLFAFLTAATAATYNGQTVSVLMSSTTFKNEPFSSATSYQGC